MRNRKILKGAVILLIVSVLLVSNLSVMANKPIDSSINTNQTNKSSDEPSPAIKGTFEIKCAENFTDGNMPPEGDYGIWDCKSAGGSSWEIWSYDPHSAPLCAAVRRGININERNETLITPNLDFSEIKKDKKIYLDFTFKGNYYTAIEKDYVDYFVNVSIDGGTTWDPVWNEDTFTEEFTTQWAEVKKIDLSKYAGNSSVLVGFQFITYSSLSPQAQYLYLDDISVYNETDIELSCYHGGPYNWWWYRQKYYNPPGVRFHAGIDPPHNWWNCKWEWGFGDGNYLNSSTPFAVHFYEDADKTYDITLKVTHTGLGVFTELKTTLWLFEDEPAPIDLTVKPFSIGIKAEIENLADVNATYVNWTMEATWGPFDIFGKVLGNGIIENLEPMKPQNIEGTSLFLKFGRIKIAITLIPDNMGSVAKMYRAFKIGPFVLGLREMPN